MLVWYAPALFGYTILDLMVETNHSRQTINPLKREKECKNLLSLFLEKSERKHHMDIFYLNYDLVVE